jgi:hypothetical protein
VASAPPEFEQGERGSLDGLFEELDLSSAPRRKADATASVTAPMPMPTSMPREGARAWQPDDENTPTPVTQMPERPPEPLASRARKSTAPPPLPPQDQGHPAQGTTPPIGVSPARRPTPPPRRYDGPSGPFEAGPISVPQPRQPTGRPTYGPPDPFAIPNGGIPHAIAGQLPSAPPPPRQPTRPPPTASGAIVVPDPRMGYTPTGDQRDWLTPVQNIALPEFTGAPPPAYDVRRSTSWGLIAGAAGALMLLVGAVVVLWPDSTPRATLGTVWVVTIPSGAEVKIDGKRVGNSPVRSDDVALDKSHSLEVSLPGHIPEAEIFSFTAGDREQRLIKQLKPDSGEVVIESVPSRGEIFVNNLPCGLAPRQCSNVPRNRAVKLEVRLSGFTTYRAELPWGTDRTLRHVAKLERRR